MSPIEKGASQIGSKKIDTKKNKKFLVINFKNYRSGVGSRAVKLAMLIEEVSFNYPNVEVFLIVEPADVYRVSHSTRLKVFSVADPVDFGRHTGSVIAEDLKENGAVGLLINHSEARLKFDAIKFLVMKARILRMKSMVCCKDIKELKKIIGLKPDFIAIEPPELIAGDISVSEAKPSLIKNAVKVSQHYKIPLLCGAGVKTTSDVKKALYYGSNGVLVASGIVNAKNKKTALKRILQGFI